MYTTSDVLFHEIRAPFHFDAYAKESPTPHTHTHTHPESILSLSPSLCQVVELLYVLKRKDVLIPCKIICDGWHSFCSHVKGCMCRYCSWCIKKGNVLTVWYLNCAHNSEQFIDKQTTSSRKNLRLHAGIFTSIHQHTNTAFRSFHTHKSLANRILTDSQSSYISSGSGGIPPAAKRRWKRLNIFYTT